MKTIKQHNRRKERTTEVTEEESKHSEKITLSYMQEQMNNLEEHSISTTSKLHSTHLPPLEVFCPIPEEDRNNVIYRLDCKDCEAVYVGETKRTLNIRANEHISAVRSACERRHPSEHCWKYNHDFDFNNKKVLDFEKHWKTRIIKEAIYSEENKHHINGISFKLPATWKPVLQKNQGKKNNCKNSTPKSTSPSRLSPYTSSTQTDQSATTTKHFDPSDKHINTKHFVIHTCLMMGEVSLETLPKENNMIQDMINADNMNSTESTILNTFKILSFLSIFSSVK